MRQPKHTPDISRLKLTTNPFDNDRDGKTLAIIVLVRKVLTHHILRDSQLIAKQNPRYVTACGGLFLYGK